MKNIYFILFIGFLGIGRIEAASDFDFVRTGFALTDGHDEFKFDTQIDFRWEFLKVDSFIFEIDQNFRMPFSQDKEQPKYVYSLSRLRTKFAMSENFRPFLSFRYDSIRGEELPTNFWASGAGFGLEWQDQFDNGINIRATLETGWLYSEAEGVNGSGQHRTYLETSIDSWWTPPQWNPFLEIIPRLRARTQSVSNDLSTGNLAILSPGVGMRFPNQTEFGFFTDITINRSNALAFTNEQESLAYGIEYRSPLTLENETRKASWAPLFYLDLNATGNHKVFAHEVRTQFVPQFLRIGRARLQFVIEAAFVRYLRNDDPSTTLYILDVGPRLAWLHGDSNDDGFAWTFDARAFHRSEHISNPSSLQNTDGPETAYLELATPGFANRRVKRTDSIFESIQLAARYQVFIFVSATRQPQWREEDYVIRASGRVFPLWFWKTQVFGGDPYIEGQRTFFGEDPVRWNLEAGWQRKQFMLFYRGESVALGHQPAFENRIEHFAGFRVFFFN